MIIVKNSNSCSSVLSDFEFSGNTTSGLESSSSIDDSMKFDNPMNFGKFLPEVWKHHEEMLIFFKNFIVDNWNADSVAGLSGLSF